MVLLFFYVHIFFPTKCYSLLGPTALPVLERYAPCRGLECVASAASMFERDSISMIQPFVDRAVSSLLLFSSAWSWKKKLMEIRENKFLRKNGGCVVCLPLFQYVSLFASFHGLSQTANRRAAFSINLTIFRCALFCCR